ncbi:formate/nitrite transporter family protein [Silvimonas sp. JCM 19000]
MSQLRSPAEIVEAMAHTGTEKATLPIWKLGLMAVLGGMFIGLGTLLALECAAGSPGLAASDPGLVKLLFGAVFPLGFIAVTLTGADLFTSNCAAGMVSAWQRHINAGTLARFWLVSYLGNMVGAVITAWLFGLQTHLITSDTSSAYLIHLAMGKVSHPFWMTFVKAMLANLLVCVAAMQGYSAKDTLGRMLGIWFPVMAFVAMGMEHSIANLFILPAAVMAGADISLTQMVWNNLIPATLGNIVGGALLIGLPYALIYTKARVRPAEEVDAVVNGAASSALPDMAH